LQWQPRFDDLATIVEHALAWERELVRRRAAAELAAATSPGSERTTRR
jgi:hypothetical protein